MQLIISDYEETYIGIVLKIIQVLLSTGAYIVQTIQVMHKNNVWIMLFYHINTCYIGIENTKRRKFYWTTKIWTELPLQLVNLGDYFKCLHSFL